MLTDKYLSIIHQRRADLRAALATLFPRPEDFVCEIGCGHGHFLTAYADTHRERRCVGLDRIGERIERARRKQARARLDHLSFMQADARLFLEELPVGARPGLVFLLFPDPWPKSRHHKHRLLQPEFLDLLANRAAPGCRLCFRTDFEPYLTEARSILDAHAHWRRVDEAWPFEHETVFQARAPSFGSFIAALRSGRH